MNLLLEIIGNTKTWYKLEFISNKMNDEEKKILSTLVKIEEYLIKNKSQQLPVNSNQIFDEDSYWENQRVSSIDRVENNCFSFYRKHCMTLTLSVETLHTLFMSLYKIDLHEAMDIFSRWESALPYLKGDTLQHILDLYSALYKDDNFSNDCKFHLAISLFERNYIEICYDIFLYLLSVPLNLIDHAECCKYLYASQDEKYKEKLIETLKNIIRGKLTSEHKLSILASISGNAIKMLYRTSNLKMPEDIDFLCELYTEFVFDENNDRRDVIKGAVYLLKKGEEETVVKVEDLLLKIGENKDYSEDTRASAYDTIMSSSKDKAKVMKSFLALSDLGYDTVTKKFKTIYDSSQNVHLTSINESIMIAIERLVREENSFERMDLNKIIKEMNPYIEKEVGTRKYNVRKALNRILVDSTTFTTQNISLPEIMCAVWRKIHTFPTADDYVSRLFDEMVEMTESCSSGYASRLINTLSGEYDVVKIGWDEQIASNISGRIYALIRNLEDGEEKDNISMGLMEDAEEEYRNSYLNFFNKHKDGLYKELYSEFVVAGYVSAKDFEKYFEKGVK